MMKHVDVIVLSAALERPLTYAVPRHLEAATMPGARVRVPFGSRSRFGVVLRASAPRDDAKLLQQVMTDDVALNQAQLDLVMFISEYYACHPAEALQLVLPPEADAAPRVRYALTDQGEHARFFFKNYDLTPKDVALLARFANGVVLDDGRLRRLQVETKRLERLVGLSLLHVEPAMAPRARTMENLVPLEHGEALPPRATGLQAMDAWLRAHHASGVVVNMDDARALFPDARARVRKLQSLQRVRVDSHPRQRSHAPAHHALLGQAVQQLSDAQEHAVHSIVQALQQRAGAFLLHGVTGSGKTEVYIRALKACLSEGRGALLVVPEIGLTQQLTSRIRAAVDEEVVVLHSEVVGAERRDAVARVQQGLARVVVGARSALFAPVANIGLIIVDEEHDASLKQDVAPRYHARDVALWWAKRQQAVCVLGSATPSYETRTNAARGKLTVLPMPTRVGGAVLMPAVTVVDMRARAEHKETHQRDKARDQQGGVVLSVPLVQALARSLEHEQQSLLFLNKRGYFSSVLCALCGEPRHCPDCSLPMTVHAHRKDTDLDPTKVQHWRCHGCGHVELPLSSCPACLAPASWRCVGVGTARVEAEVRAHFPHARVARLDRDEFPSHAALAAAMTSIAAGDVDIVVGTQLIAKGHDWPRVAVVGVVSADHALSMPDFRASERAYSLLLQVAGRAGRRGGESHVIVQTHQPGHPVLRALQTGDEAAFLAADLDTRMRLGYPPFGRALALRVEGEDAVAVASMARRVGLAIRAVPNAGRVLGPAPCVVEKLQGKTRWQVVVLSADVGTRARAVAAVRDPTLTTALQQAQVRLILDVDPVHMV
jgi:primosomal protein N' (replication factor Y) (superfamily II helicase)